jgi:hypothetical protein
MKVPPDNPEFARFTEAMRQVMGVSKVELREREKADKIRKSKRKEYDPSVSRAPASSSTVQD